MTRRPRQFARSFAAYAASLALGVAQASTPIVGGIVTPGSGTATVSVNATWAKTGGGTWGYGTIIQPQTYTNAFIFLHGGSGDEFDFCRQIQLCTLATENYNIISATWSSQYNGSITWTLSTDPTASAYGPIVVEGNPRNVAGSSVSGYNGAWTVLSVNGPAKQVVTSGPFAIPGTFAGTAVGTALTVTPNSLVYAYLNYTKTIAVFVQGVPPLGGANTGNTSVFTGVLSAGTLTASAPTSGIIAVYQVLSGTGITGTPTINGNLNTAGPTNGYAGTYTYTPNTVSAGSTTVTGSGCPTAPNTQTWDNLVMTSCIDDDTRISDLSTQLQTSYSLAPALINVMGFSEGSMMANRLRIDHGDNFGHFISVAGPTSYYYESPGGGHTTPPSVKRPWLVMEGGRDTTICAWPAGDANCGGTPNTGNITIAGTALTVNSTSSGAFAAGNVIIQDGVVTHGTYISAMSDATHGTVFPSQTVTAQNVTTNNLASTAFFNNSTNQDFSDLAFPLLTTWPSFSYSVAEWANTYTLHGCPAGLSPVQLPPASAVQAAAAVGYTLTYSQCGGYVEYVVVTEADHSFKNLTTDLGGYPPFIQAYLWAAAHPIP